MDDKVTIDYAKYARIFKVMSDPKRLKIIDMLSGRGTLCMQDSGRVSHHAANVIS